MKIFNKFATKNVGKPGLTRLWGGGAAWLLYLTIGMVRAGDTWFNGPLLQLSYFGLTDTAAANLGREAAKRGDPGPIHFAIDSLTHLFIFPDILGAPAECLDADKTNVFNGSYTGAIQLAIASARLVGRPHRILYAAGETWGCLHEFYGGYWDEALKLGFPVFNEEEDEVDTPSSCTQSQWVNSVIAGAFLSLGVIGTALYHKFTNKRAVFKVHGM
ncbi:MAG: hypothetical protein LBJ77_00815 [Holosporales bacterium]|nr:hypothetical protein [Holosporales bacterium]